MADTLFQQDILNTPRALQDTLAFLGGRPREVASALLAGGAQRFVALGNGSSWYASAASVYLHNALAKPGGTSAWAAPTGDYALYPAPLSAADALVGVSASGEVVDLLDLFQSLRGHHQIVGITNAPESALTKLVDHRLLMKAGPSLVPTATKTFTTSILALDLLWLGLLVEQGVSAAAGVKQELAAMPEAAERVTAEARGQVAEVADHLAGCSRLFVFGSGPAYPLAQEAALVFKETASLPAEAVQAREMSHGIASVVDRTVGVIAINPPGRGEAAVQPVLADCRQLGAVTLNVGRAPADLVVSASCPELLSPLVYGAPLFLLANELAGRRGINTDQPAWYEEYMRASRRAAGAEKP